MRAADLLSDLDLLDEIKNLVLVGRVEDTIETLVAENGIEFPARFQRENHDADREIVLQDLGTIVQLGLRLASLDE